MLTSIVILVAAVAVALAVGFYIGRKSTKTEIPTT